MNTSPVQIGERGGASPECRAYASRQDFRSLGLVGNVQANVCVCGVHGDGIKVLRPNLSYRRIGTREWCEANTVMILDR